MQKKRRNLHKATKNDYLCDHNGMSNTPHSTLQTRKNMTTTNTWNYVYDGKSPSEVRYVLGETFDTSKAKMLICIGVNPSKATPEKLDKTLEKVSKFAKESGEYGAWFMLNLYPFRATDPKDLPKEADKELHERNVEEIKKLISTIPAADVWCAWGGSIEDRKYLVTMRDEILGLIGDKYPLMDRGTIGGGHPMHPSASIPHKPLQEHKPVK
jgi:hypothetical protein